MKVCLVENFGADFVGARLRLAIYLRNEGFQVTAIVPRDGHKEIIESFGIKVIEVRGDIRKVGIYPKLQFARELKSIFQGEKFDIIHFFRLQPNLIGTLVAGLFTSAKIVNHITGLGVVFSSTTLKNSSLKFIIKTLYRANSFFFKTHMIYQNDQDAFDLGIHRNSIVIYGSSVDETRFDLSKVLMNKTVLENLRSELRIKKDTIIFLFVSRLLKEKGVLELIEAFKVADKELRKPIKLLIVGWCDIQNPSVVDLNVIESAVKESDSISFLGKRADVEFLLGISQVSILPTYYREGTPRFLLESMVMHNAIITTKMPGCDHLVPENKNGLLIEPKSIDSIKRAIIEISNKNLDLLGRNSNKLYFDKFSEARVNKAVLDLYMHVLFNS